MARWAGRRPTIGRVSTSSIPLLGPDTAPKFAWRPEILPNLSFSFVHGNASPSQILTRLQSVRRRNGCSHTGAATLPQLRPSPIIGIHGVLHIDGYIRRCPAIFTAMAIATASLEMQR